eukprot:jgi/Chlat1/4281/Chrsp29S04553
MDGFNVCVFAYGQTGSGKTHTMEGTTADRGLTHRAFAELFRIAQETWGVYRYKFRVTMMEIYNETIRDLLVKKGTDDKKHDIKTAEDGSTYVSDVETHNVATPEDFVDLLKNGSRNRSKLSLVDLAGSERLSKTEATGDRLKESLHINKSLSALGDVVAALTSNSGKQGGGHVPYRNSKLTHLLADSLGNDSKTLLFVNCSPAAHNAPETACSLMFAARARNVDLSGHNSGGRRFKELVNSVKEMEASRQAYFSFEADAASEKRSLQQDLGKALSEVESMKQQSVSKSSEDAARVAELERQLRERDARIEQLTSKNSNPTSHSNSISVKDNSSSSSDAVISNSTTTSEAGGSSSNNNISSGKLDAKSRKKLETLTKHLNQSSQVLKESEEEIARLTKRVRELEGVRDNVKDAKDVGEPGNNDDKENRAVGESEATAQVLALTDTNKQLQKKCKIWKLEKQKLEQELAQRDEQIKLLQQRQKLSLLNRRTSRAEAGDTSSSSSGSSGSSSSRDRHRRYSSPPPHVGSQLRPVSPSRSF